MMPRWTSSWVAAALAAASFASCDNGTKDCGEIPDAIPAWEQATLTLGAGLSTSVGFYFHGPGPFPLCVRRVPNPDPLFVCTGTDSPIPGAPTSDCVMVTCGIQYCSPGTLTISATAPGTFGLYFELSATEGSRGPPLKMWGELHVVVVP
jgi:hypothetical protein